MKTLSKRLITLADMVTPHNRVCDVGCDHGYVCIELLKRGISPYALAMDVNEGPLLRASENIKAAGLEDRITVRLSDGLEKYQLGEADTLLIAGMGGPLINDILFRDINITSDFKELVLSPQSEISGTRKVLSENGFTFVDERMIYEDDKYYVLMKVVPDREAGVILKEEELEFGPVLLERGDEVLNDYLHYSLNKMTGVLNNLKEYGANDSIHQRIEEISNRIELLKMTLDLYF